MKQKYNISRQEILDLLANIINIRCKITDNSVITVFGYSVIDDDYMVDYNKYSNSKNELYRTNISSNDFDVYYRKLKLKKLDSFV